MNTPGLQASCGGHQQVAVWVDPQLRLRSGTACHCQLSILIIGIEVRIYTTKRQRPHRALLTSLAIPDFGYLRRHRDIRWLSLEPRSGGVTCSLGYGFT